MFFIIYSEAFVKAYHVHGQIRAEVLANRIKIRLYSGNVQLNFHFDFTNKALRIYSIRLFIDYICRVHDIILLFHLPMNILR